MNLKLKRLVRTNTSEQYALYDLDQSDRDDQPLIIGKVDLHYTGEGVYGTLLLWDEATRRLRPPQRRAFVNAILGEITQPMGVPNEFVVEFFMPSLDHYELFHNVGVDEENDSDMDEEIDADAETEYTDTEEIDPDDLDEAETDTEASVEDEPDDSAVDAYDEESNSGAASDHAARDGALRGHSPTSAQRMRRPLQPQQHS